MRAKAAITYGLNKIIFDDVEVREPVADEVRVKVTSVGICGTDITAIEGAIGIFPTVLGHEGSGIVEAVGPDVKKIKVGDRVSITYTSCGTCKYCRQGKPNACDLFMTNFFSPGKLSYKNAPLPSWFGQNSFATTTLTTEGNLCKIPDGFDPKYAGPYGCGIMTGAGCMFDCNPGPDKTAIVFGLGTVGMSALMAAKMAGCQTIIAVGGTPWKLELAKELGATHIVNRREEEDLVAAIKKIAPQGGDCVVEATGHTEMAVTATKVLARLSTLHFAAVYHEPFPFFPDMAANATYKHCAMGNWASVKNVEMLMQATVDGKFPADKLMQFYKFDDMDKAMDDLAKQKVIKAVLLTE